VDEIRVDGLLAQVRLRIGDQQLTAVITRDGVEALKLKRGPSCGRRHQGDRSDDRARA
jgi:molybdopterin-binding protein